MMKCSFCGHENTADALFCSKCKSEMSVPEAVMPTASGELDVEEFLAGGALPELTPADTLHFEKIPLVESLGTQQAESGELTKLASAIKEAMIPSLSSATLRGRTATPPPTAAAVPGATATDTRPRLVVTRGEKIDMQYPIYAGKNFLGRTDEKPVDIDLENQEPSDRIWTSRQHAVITFDNGTMTIEDLNSLNGTFVNRTRVHPGQVRTLQANDIIQVGTVQMRVLLT